MTIPTRPAPAPPGSRAQNAAAGANASIEQFRKQLHEQQKLTIKLPPPPKGPLASSNYNNNNSNSHSNSITRKFPQARYAPTTNWNDSPFDLSNNGSSINNGFAKKVPPPRPPPPKVPANVTTRKTTTTTTAQLSSNLLTNIFQRKKSSKNSTSMTNGGTTRTYSVSSTGSKTSGVSSSYTANSWTSSSHNNNNINSDANNADWNAVWNNAPTITSSYASNTTTASSVMHTTSNNAAPQEAQLISFDSPPSSPTFTQKSNSDCVSVDSFSSDSNFSSPNNGSVSQPESGFEDDFSSVARSRPATTSPLDPWETLENFGNDTNFGSIGTAPVRNLNSISTRMQHSNDNPLCNGKSLLPPPASLNMPTIIKPKISQKPKAPKPPVFKASSAYLKACNGGNITPPSPPMPNCAPPPPPTTATGGVTLLDVISGKADALQLGAAAAYADDAIVEQPYGIALYNFDGTEEGDLCFKENEKIYLLEQVSETWYSGRTRAGCVGIFPANYIDIKVALSAAAPAKASATTNGYGIQNSYAAQSSVSSKTAKVRCLYNFPAEVDGDLALKEDEMVTILYKINEDWLFGETIDGRQGQFPANFLEYVPANIPTL